MNGQVLLTGRTHCRAVDLNSRSSGLRAPSLTYRVSPGGGWPAVILRLAVAQAALGISEQYYCNENRQQALVLGMFSLLIILLFWIE